MLAADRIVQFLKEKGIKKLHNFLGRIIAPMSDEFIQSSGPILWHLDIDGRHDVLPMLLMNKMWSHYDAPGVKNKALL